MNRKRPATSRHRRADSDLHKGAVEPDKPHQEANNSLHGQLPHRPENQVIDGHDSDFPEPGGNPEHQRRAGGKEEP